MTLNNYSSNNQSGEKLSLKLVPHLTKQILSGNRTNGIMKSSTLFLSIIFMSYSLEYDAASGCECFIFHVF